MQIILTPQQWGALKRIVAQGEAAERSLGKSIEVSNADMRIELTEDEIKINLPDED